MIRLRVVPLESSLIENDEALLGFIADALRASFSVDVDITAPLEAPEFAYDATRKQYNSPEILKWLIALHAQSALPSCDHSELSRGRQEAVCSPSLPSRDREGAGPPDGPPTKILAVTNRDLYIPMLSFVYGQAQLDGTVAIVSLARLRTAFYGLPNDAALLDVRARKEAIHEVGHLFGLVHCPDTSCAMTLSTGVAQLDHKQPALCTGCAALIASKRESLERAP